MAEAKFLLLWNALLTLEELIVRNLKLIYMTVLWNASSTCLDMSPPKLWYWSSVDGVEKQSHKGMVGLWGLPLMRWNYGPPQRPLSMLSSLGPLLPHPLKTQHVSLLRMQPRGGGGILQAENIVYWICQCLGHGLAASSRKLLPFCLL